MHHCRKHKRGEENRRPPLMSSSAHYTGERVKLTFGTSKRQRASISRRCDPATNEPAEGHHFLPALRRGLPQHHADGSAHRRSATRAERLTERLPSESGRS